MAGILGCLAFVRNQSFVWRKDNVEDNLKLSLEDLERLSNTLDGFKCQIYLFTRVFCRDRDSKAACPFGHGWGTDGWDIHPFFFEVLAHLNSECWIIHDNGENRAFCLGHVAAHGE